MKISALSKKKRSQQIRISSVLNEHSFARLPRRAMVSNTFELSSSKLARGLDDRSVTINNHMMRQIMEGKVRTLIDQRNGITSQLDFAMNMEKTGEGHEEDAPPDLVAIDRKLDAIERHLDGHEQILQRLARTKEILTGLDQKFDTYRQLLEEYDAPR